MGTKFSEDAIPLYRLQGQSGPGRQACDGGLPSGAADQPRPRRRRGAVGHRLRDGRRGAGVHAGGGRRAWRISRPAVNARSPRPKRDSASSSPMPKAGIQFADAAFVDLEALRSWYAEQDIPEIGERLLREIIDSIEVPRRTSGDGPDRAGVRATVAARAHPPTLAYRLSARSEARADRAGMAQRAPARTAGRTCALSVADERIITL